MRLPYIKVTRKQARRRDKQKTSSAREKRGTPVDDRIDEDLDGVLVGEQVDDLKRMLDDAHRHQLLAVVAPVHHQRVGDPAVAPRHSQHSQYRVACREYRVACCGVAHVAVFSLIRDGLTVLMPI